jgi:IS5 family transposase
MNTRSTGPKTYHLMVSFRPEDEAKLALENLREVEQFIASTLGFQNHQRHIGVHWNTDNLHMHVAYNMIDPVKFTKHQPYWDFQKLSRACRELEAKYGLAVDRGLEEALKGFKPRTNVKAQTLEAHSGQESLYSYVIRQKEKILTAREASGTWLEFQEALLKIGLEIKLRGHGLTLKDRHGKHQVKPSDIDRNISKNKLEILWGPFQEHPNPGQVTSEERYSARALQLAPERGHLFQIFQAEMAERKRRLDEVKAHEVEMYGAAKERWRKLREFIRNHPMMKADRNRLLEELKIREAEVIRKNRLDLAERRKEIRDTRPYTNWTKFLQFTAGQGNEVALAILRSRKLEVPPEAQLDQSSHLQIQVYAGSDKHQAHRQALIKTHGLSDQHRMALLAVVTMNELLDREGCPPLNYRIDAKGTVIFYLPGGGAIRDTGREIHFSAQPPAVGELARKFAAARWKGWSFNDNDINLAFISPKKKQFQVVSR